MPDSNIARELQRSLRILTIATVLLYLLLAGAVVWAFQARTSQIDRVRRDEAQTSQALCTFRHDLADRVGQSRQFLHDHPEGFAGIPAATIRATIDNQQRTIDSLRSLHCPAP